MVAPSVRPPKAELRRAARGRRRWFHSKQRAVDFSRQHVQQTVRSLTHVADPILKLFEHRLSVQLFPFVVEVETNQLARSRHFTLPHPACEDVSLPGRKS